MSLTFINKIKLADWNRSVQSFENFSFFHHYFWQGVMQRGMGMKPEFLIKKNKNQITGLLPVYFKKGILGGSRFITLPFGEAGPLGDKQTEKALIDKAFDIAKKKQASLEIFSINKLEGLKPEIYCEVAYGVCLLETDKTYEEIFRRMHKKTRNMVRKAEKLGIIIERGKLGDLRTFYRLYLKTMRKLGGLALPSRIFNLVWQKFSKEIKLLKAIYENKILGYLWLFIWNDTLYIWANATEEKYLSLGTNYALYDAAIN